MIISTALICLALNIYHEARDQGYDGMAAVAVVTLDRAQNDPNQVCEEVFRPQQFSWANRLTTANESTRVARAPDYLPKEDAAWEASKIIASQALKGGLDSEIVATVGDSDHYYNPKKVATPTFARVYRKVAKVGDHVFYSSKASGSNVPHSITYLAGR